jgi:hypothetical protein
MNGFLICRTAVLILALTALLTSGCATIVKGGSQGVTVKTDPPGANCDLSRKGQSVGVVNPTPGTVQLGKSATALDVICRKPGYLDASTKLSSSVQGWTFGNVLLGGFVGILVDAGSGALHEYQPEISVKLLPESFGSEESRDAYFNSWRDDLLSQSEKNKAGIAGKCAKSECEKLLKKADDKIEETLTEVESSRKRATIAPIAAGQAAPLPPTSHIETISVVKAVKAASALSTESDQFLKVGDTWKYKFNDRGRDAGSVTVEIMESSGRKARERFTREGYKGFVAERDVEAVFSPSHFLAPVALPGGYLLTEIAPYLPPGTELKAGQIWSGVPGIFFMPASGRKTLASQVRVVKQETVRVPAGAFASWRIETESEEDSSGQGAHDKVKCTFWYSQDMKRTIKMTIDTIAHIQVRSGSEAYELASFNPGK